MSVNYKSGSVESYDDRSGYGFILPDEPEGDAIRLLVHRKSLRTTSMQLEQGERVLFKTELVARGVLATDVHLETPDQLHADTPGAVDESEDVHFGVVATLLEAKSFGFIQDDDGNRRFFHLSQLVDGSRPPSNGARVSFRALTTERGLQAKDISSVRTDLPESESVTEASPKKQENWLALAILARDSKNLDEAARLYQRGMRESPSVQLVTSYAAMEKNRNRRGDAVAIYERGLALYPGNPKLLVDAGVLAASIGDHTKALTLLERGLEVSSRDVDEGGQRQLLLALARIHANRGGLADLQKSLEYFRRAKQLFDRNPFGRQSFPRSDLLTMDIASVRVQHNRGNLTYNFLNRCGFKILRSRLLEQTTVGADIVVGVQSAELTESYGLAGDLLVRCMFKADVSLSDIESLEKTIAQWGFSDLVDDQVAILIVASLPEAVEALLFRRIEDRKKTSPAILPLTQAQLESSDGPMSVLRQVLDRWLYRRDLFAQNFPVTGRRFFGRDRPLAELRDAISNGTAAGIFGLRKVGKTSLLKEIQRRSVDTGDIVVYLDLLSVPADVTDTRWLYWRIAAELKARTNAAQIRGVNWRLGGVYPDYMDVPPQFRVATAFDSDLSQVLSALQRHNASPRPKLVLMLDEIERLLPGGLGKEGFTGFLDFVGYLRGVAQGSQDFVPIITGANAAIAEASQFSGRDNPAFNFFREIYLPLLQPSETAVMIQTLGRGMGIRFSREVCQRIHRLTGGHPFFTRRFCSFLSERYPERPFAPTTSKVEAQVDIYLEMASKDFQEIVDRFARDYPEELEACITIANSGGSVALRTLTENGKRRVSLRHLLGYQVIELHGESATLTMELMQRWLPRGSQEGRA
jgi:cold shock CspA family protein